MSAATSSRSCATSSRSASASCKEERRKQVQAKAHLAAEERVLDALVGATASAATRDSFRRKLRANELDDKEIEIEMQAGAVGLPMFEIPGLPGASMGAINLSATCSARPSAAAARRRGARPCARPTSR